MNWRKHSNEEKNFPLNNLEDDSILNKCQKAANNPKAIAGNNDLYKLESGKSHTSPISTVSKTSNGLKNYNIIDGGPSTYKIIRDMI